MLMVECYMDCNSAVKALVAPSTTTGMSICVTLPAMEKREQGQHFMRQWREDRGISLRKLAARLEVEPGGDPLVTYAQLSRIETGEQPFSEPVLNAVAFALDVSRTMLLEMDPKKEGHAVDLLNKMDPGTRDQAVRMLELMLQSTAA